MTMPVLFVSHGSPMLGVEDDEIGVFLEHYVKKIKPKACLVISAHWDESDLKVTGSKAPETIHDFHGFPKELYQVNYPALGDVNLAEQVAKLVNADIDYDRGMDHGAWVVMKMLFPAANIPVVQLSISLRHGAQWHYEMGTKLESLRDEGYLIIGSGGIVHNLSTMKWDNKKAPIEAWCNDFLTAFESSVFDKGAQSAVNPYVFPYGRKAVPTLEHYVPFLVSAGAAEDKNLSKIYNSWQYGTLSMQVYEWL